jgi:hypothetical protein
MIETHIGFGRQTYQPDTQSIIVVPANREREHPKSSTLNYSAATRPSSGFWSPRIAGLHVALEIKCRYSSVQAQRKHLLEQKRPQTASTLRAAQYRYVAPKITPIYWKTRSTFHLRPSSGIGMQSSSISAYQISNLSNGAKKPKARRHVEETPVHGRYHAPPLPSEVHIRALPYYHSSIRTGKNT